MRAARRRSVRPGAAELADPVSVVFRDDRPVRSCDAFATECKATFDINAGMANDRAVRGHFR
ncbi:hypothetical protein C7H84_31695 [Burkholderia sp. Nafp2/4-1b]|nr:hypothetical protein C7H84_31695 [Burkholderia sp. Nafp2/4-1b]